MVKNAKVLERFEQEQLRKERLTYAQKLAIFNALWNEHLHLNGKRRSNSLEGLESRIGMAAILNHIPRNPNPRYVKKLLKEFMSGRKQCLPKAASRRATGDYGRRLSG